MNKGTCWQWSTQITLELIQTQGAEPQLRLPQYTRLPYLWHKMSSTKYSYQHLTRRFQPISTHSINNTKFTSTFMLPCIVIDFFLNNQPDALIIQIYSVIKLYMFRASSLSIISSFPLHIKKISMKLNSAECTVENSWWWTKKMPETCRVL